MHNKFNQKFKRKSYEIYAGEYFVTSEKNIVIQTLLGSCVAACLQDDINQITGINHFMLPGQSRSKELRYNDDYRYGINSMEILINTMMKKGAQRKNLKAKVFGGGRVLQNSLNRVSKSNVKFIKEFLEMEEIPLLNHDLGGIVGRKIILLPDSFKVYLKKIEITSLSSQTIEREKELLEKSKEEKDQSGELTMFE